MERRVLLAVVLSFLTVVAFQMATGQCSPRPAQKKADPAPEGAAPGGGVPGGPGVPPPAPGAPDPAPAPPPPAEVLGPQADVEPGADVSLESDELIATFGNPGGCLKSLLLKRAHDPGRSEPLALIAPADPLHGLGAIDDVEVVPGEAPGPADRKEPRAGPLRTLSWSRDAAAEAATPAQDVVYRFVAADGRTFEKRWSLSSGANRYDIHLALRAWGKEGAAAAPVALKLLTSGGLLAEQPTGSVMGPETTAIRRRASEKDQEIEDLSQYGLPTRDLKATGENADTLALLGVRSQYFLVCAYRARDQAPLPTTRTWATGEEAGQRDAMYERLKAWFAERFGRVAEDGKDAGLKQRLSTAVRSLLWTWVGLELPSRADAAPVEVSFFAGPVERSVLRSADYPALAPVVTYPGGPDWLADILLWIYDRWRGLLGSVGLAVILMTLTVRGLLMPLSIRNQLSMRRYGRRVQKLKPKLEALKQRFAGNPQRLREETMALYREHGVGFPAGCLMMLLQIPIFFALFASLRTEYTLRGAPFAWIPELSGQDRLIDLPFRIPFLIGDLTSINLLPLIMVVLSVFQMRSMPKPMDEQQAQQMRMMKWMPILFAVILYNYTAALSLYMVISSALALVESKVVRMRDEAEVAAAS